MSNKKIALVTMRVDHLQKIGETRECLDQRLLSFLLRCDLIPICCPSSISIASHLLHYLSPSILVLSGGNDIGSCPERDCLESYLYDFFSKRSLPILGICRGCQFIYTYNGGSLHTVSNYVKRSVLIYPHSQSSVENTLFHRHSYFTQAIPLASMPNNLIPTSLTEGDLVMSLREISKPIYGLMWHPEREPTFYARDIIFVRSLLN